MVKSSKSYQEEEEYDDEEFVVRTDDSSQKGESMLKVDGKSNEQKENTPRSKHSATEQRRRSKINERFQILRDLIPQNDQKRDKASFLLEVIEYIQFLKEKLHMYEGSYQGWSQEPTKLIPWRNHRGPVENFVDHSQVVKNGSDHENNVVVNPAMLANAQNSLEADFSTAAAYKAMDHPPGAAAQTIPLNISVQPTVLSPVGRSGMPSLPQQGSVSDAENMASHPQSQLWQARPCTTECAVTSNTLNEQEELTVESGTDSISTAYSQGLLNTLTQVLQSSGVDLSQASISVQFDIGKRDNSRLTSTTSGTKDHENPSTTNQGIAHFGVGSFYEDSNHAHKRLRTEKS